MNLKYKLLIYNIHGKTVPMTYPPFHGIHDNLQSNEQTHAEMITITIFANSQGTCTRWRS